MGGASGVGGSSSGGGQSIATTTSTGTATNGGTSTDGTSGASGASAGTSTTEAGCGCRARGGRTTPGLLLATPLVWLVGRLRRRRTTSRNLLRD
jgi:hypothetical protein